MSVTEAGIAEAAIAPELAIVDTHHHFWGAGHFGAGKFGNFLPEDLTAAIERSGHRMAATVYVDCGWAFRKGGPEHLRCVGETEYVEAVAESFANTLKSFGKIGDGIVGRADLVLGDSVAEVLEAHIEASPTRFRGIRELVAYDPEAYQALNIPPGKAFDPRFREGFRQLARLGLSCDLLCVHTMLEEVIDLARAFPATPIIINHLGGPIGIGRFENRRDEVFADWRSKIDALARCPNVAMKLSGFGSDVMGLGLGNAGGAGNSTTVSAAIEPYIRAAIDAFSPARCMVGSNFPVDRQSFDYGTLWNALKRIFQSYSADEQRQLLSDTAKWVYRLAL